MAIGVPKMSVHKLHVIIALCVACLFGSLFGEDNKLFCERPRPSDIVFILDCSSDLTPEEFAGIKTYVKQLLPYLDIAEDDDETHVALVLYSDSPVTKYKFSDPQTEDEFNRALDEAQQCSSSDSDIYYALSFTELDVLNGLEDRLLTVNTLFIITGTKAVKPVNNAVVKHQKETVTRLKEKGTRIFVMTFGEASSDYVLLSSLATRDIDESQKHTFSLNDFPITDQQTMITSVKDLEQRICRDTQLCTETADIAIIIDESGSIEPRWNTVKKIITDLIDKLPISRYNVRVALIRYSNYARVEFGFGALNDKASITTIVNGLKQKNQNTNTTGSLRKARLDVFTDKDGDRPDIRNMIVLFSDGFYTWGGDPLEEARMCHDAGIQIYTVCPPGECNRTSLGEIASHPVKSHMFELSDGTYQVQDQMTKLMVLNWVGCRRTDFPEDELGLDIQDLGYCDRPLDLAIVVDGSGSVGQMRFMQYLDYARTIIQNLAVDSGEVRVALITYSTGMDIRFLLKNFTTTKDIMTAIDACEYTHGTTPTDGALRMVREIVFVTSNGDRSDVRNVVLLMTDGESNDPDLAFKESMELKRKGVTIITLGFGDSHWIREIDMKGIASEPRDINSYIFPAKKEAEYAIPFMIDSMCNRMDECSTLPCDQGSCSDGTRGYSCSCNASWAGQNCDKPCNLVLDIVFAVDSSGTVGEKRFQMILDFIRDIVNELPFSAVPEASTRVGLVTFGREGNIRLNLTTYTEKDSLLNSLYFDYNSGSTNMADALRKIQSMYTPENGDRKFNPNVVVFFLDGKSDKKDKRDNKRDTWQEAVRTRNMGIHIMGVAVGNMYDAYEVEGLVTPPIDSSLFQLKGFENLNDIKEALFTSLCNVDDECTSAPCQNNGQCMDSIRSVRCGCKDGFFGDQCEIPSHAARDVVFMVDLSDEMRCYNRPIVVDFIYNIVQQMKIGPTQDDSRIGIVTFGEAVQEFIQLDEYFIKSDLLHALAKMPCVPGKPDVANALEFVNREVFNFADGDRELIKNYLIVLTEGYTDSPEKAIASATKARLAGTHVIVVGVADMQKHTMQYSAMASYPQNETAFTTGRIKKIRNIWPQVVDVLLDDTNECLRAGCQNGATCVDKAKDFLCICPNRRTGILCDKRCDRRFDLTIVQDTSGSMTSSYDLGSKAIRSLVHGVNIRYTDTRVAYVTFDDYARLHFDFEKYTSKGEVLEAISNIADVEGETNAMDALNLVRDLSEQYGRKTVRQIVVWFSDGKLEKGTQRTMSLANSMKVNGNLELYVVGLGTNLSKLSLDGLATDPVADHRMDIPNDTRVETVINKLLSRICL